MRRVPRVALPKATARALKTASDALIEAIDRGEDPPVGGSYKSKGIQRVLRDEMFEGLCCSRVSVVSASARPKSGTTGRSSTTDPRRAQSSSASRTRGRTSCGRAVAATDPKGICGMTLRRFSIPPSMIPRRTWAGPTRDLSLHRPSLFVARRSGARLRNQSVPAVRFVARTERPESDVRAARPRRASMRWLPSRSSCGAGRIVRRRSRCGSRAGARRCPRASGSPSAPSGARRRGWDA